jgi:hypothetical protein
MTGAFVATAVHHELGFALRFEDIFHRPSTPTTPPIRTRLEVAIPARRWTALYAGSDGTYRFAFKPGQDVTGLHDVVVTSLDGIYVNHEAIQVTLPRTVSTPPVAADFLVTKPLWPTRSFRVPAGETAVIGRIVHPTLRVSGLRVQLYRGASPPPTGAYTYSDPSGEFVFRLLKLGGAIPGGTVTDVKIDVTDAGLPIAVTPAMFTVELGRTQPVTFTRT